MEESAASRANVEYEIADGSALFEMVKFAGGYSDAGLPPAVHNMGLVLAPVEALAFVFLAALAVRRRPI